MLHPPTTEQGRASWAGLPSASWDEFGDECNCLIYKRACQEHFSLFAGARVNSRHPVPLTMGDGCRGLGLFHLSSSIFFGRDDADQFRNESSRAVVRCQPWIYLRLLA